MSSFIVHYSWFIFFSLISFCFLLLSIWVTLFCCSYIFSFDLFSSWFSSFTVSFSFDLFSSWFSFTVTFISAIIIIYSYFYMSPYSNTNYFIWITVFFVLSMLLVINMNNFFFIMLGWDGLGLVSFFLIVYYQNHSSIYSGLFTVLINRIGDCFFIISISLMFLLYPYMWDTYFYPTFMLLTFMLLTFITNSAIYPFSPWLPLAIAAPTPISALVHSSTLVTAGLYLSMRFSFLIYSSSFLISLFLVLSVFTSFYAGLNSVFETDMNKLIALSTLSHLGFIGIAFSCGLLYLSFFHLLVHALFNSVLFISIGDIMTNLFHSQDIRFLSSGFGLTNSSFYTIAVSLINLLGLPTMSGYFSNDFVLETCNFSYVSQFMVFLIFFNVIFTYYYTYQLFYFSFSTLKLTPYVLIHSSSLTHSLCLLSLSLLGVFFGFLWITYILPFVVHVTVPLVWKLTPYVLNLIIFSFLFLNLNMLSFNNNLASFYFSNIMFLSCLIITFSSNIFLLISFYSCKSVEYGVFNWFVNNSLYRSFTAISFSLFNILFSNVLLLVFVSSFLTLFLFLALLSNNINNYTQLLLALSLNEFDMPTSYNCPSPHFCLYPNSPGSTWLVLGAYVVFRLFSLCF